MNPLKFLALAALVSALAAMPGPAPAQQQTGDPGQAGAPAPGSMMGPGMGYGMGPGMMGQGTTGQGMMGMGRGMGPGMSAGNCPLMGAGMMGMGAGMGPGMGRGMMGSGWGYIPPPVNLSVADVKSYMERWVEAMGNPRLKLGKVAEKDADTITAEIVTKDDSVVQELEVDRHSGFFRPAQ